MNINNLFNDQKEIIENHKEKFNHLRMRNQVNHKNVKSIINKKIDAIENHKRRTSGDFNMIRNKRQ